MILKEIIKLHNQNNFYAIENEEGLKNGNEEGDFVIINNFVENRNLSITLI